MLAMKIISVLLQYPSENLIAEADSVLDVVNSDISLTEKAKKEIRTFLGYVKETDLITQQEHYVTTFDRGRAHCLHLFEHIHGESRDRGSALANLLEVYEEKGLEINTAEMPDYLPLFLEYLSLCSAEDISHHLNDIAHIIAIIEASLKGKENIYSHIFTVLYGLTDMKIAPEFIQQQLEEKAEDINDFDELDKEWEEAEAFSNDGLDDCNTCSIQMESTINNITGGK